MVTWIRDQLFWRLGSSQSVPCRLPQPRSPHVHPPWPHLLLQPTRRHGLWRMRPTAAIRQSGNAHGSHKVPPLFRMFQGLVPCQSSGLLMTIASKSTCGCALSAVTLPGTCAGTCGSPGDSSQAISQHGGRHQQQHSNTCCSCAAPLCIARIPHSSQQSCSTPFCPSSFPLHSQPALAAPLCAPALPHRLRQRSPPTARGVCAEQHRSRAGRCSSSCCPTWLQPKQCLFSAPLCAPAIPDHAFELECIRAACFIWWLIFGQVPATAPAAPAHGRRAFQGWYGCWFADGARWHAAGQQQAHVG